MKRRLLASAAALLACGSLQVVGAPTTESCTALQNLPLDNATVTLAQEVPAGSFRTPPGCTGSPPFCVTNTVPAFCRVALTVSPAINIEVWLPKTTWNERYRGEGGGGYAGSISYGGLVQGINAGYATSSTDTGHVGGSGSFAFNPDGTLNWGLIEDFAERSLHELAIKSKIVINAYYGEAPKYSYWNGCSTGGRQGLMAVQRFPEEYDGLILAAPAINWERFIAAELWPQVVMKEELGRAIGNAKLNRVTADAVAACDKADGVEDGVINDPRKCDYDPAASVCPAGDASTCLTTAEADAVRKIWNGPTDANGKRLWFGLERGASLTGLAGAAGATTNAAPFPIAVTHMQWVMQNPTFDWQTISEATFPSAFRLSQRTFNEVIGTDDDNVQAFRKRGGKMIIWHGEADQLIMPRGTLNYFNRVLTGNGGPKHVDGFARLFMAPGVGHCAGGNGPNPVLVDPDAQRGQGLFDSIVKWVETGVAPEQIIARRVAGGVTTERPLCPYPKTAMYTSGDPNKASNFACVDARHDAADFKITGPGSQ
jgi:pimeloyl-ACP methyl ester carboxylesterase